MQKQITTDYNFVLRNPHLFLKKQKIYSQLNISPSFQSSPFLSFFLNKNQIFISHRQHNFLHEINYKTINKCTYNNVLKTTTKKSDIF